MKKNGNIFIQLPHTEIDNKHQLLSSINKLINLLNLTIVIKQIILSPSS